MAEIGIGTQPPVSTRSFCGCGWVPWVNPDCTQAPRMAECLGLLAAYNLALLTSRRQKVPDMDQVIYYGAADGAALEGYADVFSWNVNATKMPSNFSVVATMATQKPTASRTFSLAYGSKGGLVFSGVDNRFKGSLHRTPIIPRDPIVDGWWYWAPVTRVQHAWPNGTLGASLHTPGSVDNHIFNGTCMVDSSTTRVYVPRSVYGGIMREMNLTQDGLRAEQFPIVGCDMAKLNGSLSFSIASSPSEKNWSSFDINMPYSALMHPQRNRQTNETSCFFTLRSGGRGLRFTFSAFEFFKAAHVMLTRTIWR